jgi:hypothetical protein
VSLVDSVQIAVSLASGACGLAALLSGFRRLRGTTLRAPWWWAAISLALVASGEVAIALWRGGESSAAAQYRFATGTMMFCPLVALLGAKRPQDRAWQFIVFSCWVILTLPAAQARLLRPDEPPSVHPLWGWFLVVLIVVGLTNYLPTRFCLAGLLAAAGQATLLWPFLPFGSLAAYRLTSLFGLVLLGAAAVAAAVLARTRRRAGDPLDLMWLDFRDQFGVVWGLRIAERLNASAKMCGWDARLAWHGFLTAAGGPAAGIPPAVNAELEKSLRGLLRRFVSDEWIGRRAASVSRPSKS